MGTLVNFFPRRDDFFAPLEQSFNDFFNDFFKSPNIASIKDHSRFPKMDILENDKNQFQIKAVVAGWSENDIQVELLPGNVVAISGDKKDEYDGLESQRADMRYHVRELKQSSFCRSIQLPDYVQGDPKAVMKDGILTLTWDTVKPVEVEKVKKIAIKSE